VPVRARAVARGQWVPAEGALIALDPDDRGAVNAHGNGSIVVTGGSVIVNSSDSSALLVNGSNAVISAPEYDVTGDTRTTGGGTILGTVHRGVPPIPDPLAYLVPPDPASLPLGTITAIGKDFYRLTPGRFPGGLSFSSKDSVLMEPGIYYLAGGGFKFSGKAGTSLTATGVMIYNAPTGTSHRIEITGQGRVSISPPTSGPYQGISIFQDRDSDVTFKITGNGSFDLTGTVYAAGSHGQIEGNGAVHMGSQYITGTLDVGGNGTTRVDYNNNASRERRVDLVE
jgi:hypothetical protein